MKYIIILVITVFLINSVNAQKVTSLEEQRELQLQSLGHKVPDPELISKLASEEFSKPEAEQSIEQLKEIADTSNLYSNLVNKIYEGYKDYRRDNYKYDFVQEAIDAAPIFEELMEINNKYKNIRNQALILIGKKYLAEGKRMEAFIYFDDAFRLSAFSCYDGKEECPRYIAEQHMKELLGIKGQSYTTWKK